MTNEKIPPPLTPEELQEKIRSGTMRIVFASQTQVKVYDKEVQALLTVIGSYMVDDDGDPAEWAAHCCVSDLSKIGDFMPFEFNSSSEENANRRVRQENLAEIGQKLGFSVSGQDYTNWYRICTLTIVITRVYLYDMKRPVSSPKRQKGGKRSGVPLTVYLPEPQAARLNEISKMRHVTKATIVRFAVDQLFVQPERRPT